MITVYSLRLDEEMVRRVQHATLTTEEFGLQMTHGLFGSKEWWGQVDSGRLPIQTVSGVVSRVFMGSMNDWPEFEMLDSTGKKWTWTRWANSKPLAAEYKVGRPVAVDYVVQYFRSEIPSLGREVKEVVAIRLDEEG